MNRRKVMAATLCLTALATVSGCNKLDPNPAVSTETAAPSDLLNRTVTIGWLPKGMAHNLTRSGKNYQVRYGQLNAEIEIEVWPAGRSDLQSLLPDDTRFADTASIGNIPARWLQVSPETGVLRWEYQPGGWAQVGIRGLAGNPQDVARQVAENMKFGVGERIRLPWRLTGIPAGFSAKSLQVIADTSYKPWQVEIVFGKPGVGQHDETSLIVRAHKGPPLGEPSPNTVVHGHPAQLTPDADGSEVLTIFAPNNIVHEIFAAPKALAMLGPGGLTSLAAQFELLGDPATWTDQAVPCC